MTKVSHTRRKNWWLKNIMAKKKCLKSKSRKTQILSFHLSQNRLVNLKFSFKMKAIWLNLTLNLRRQKLLILAWLQISARVTRHLKRRISRSTFTSSLSLTSLPRQMSPTLTKRWSYTWWTTLSRKSIRLQRWEVGRRKSYNRHRSAKTNWLHWC